MCFGKRLISETFGERRGSYDAIMRHDDASIMCEAQIMTDLTYSYSTPNPSATLNEWGFMNPNHMNVHKITPLFFEKQRFSNNSLFPPLPSFHLLLADVSFVSTSSTNGKLWVGGSGFWQYLYIKIPFTFGDLIGIQTTAAQTNN